MAGLRLQIFWVLKKAIYGYGMDQFSNHSSQVNVSKCRGYYPERDAAGLVSLMLKILLEWYAWGLGHSAWGLGHFAVHPEVSGIPRN